MPVGQDFDLANRKEVVGTPVESWIHKHRPSESSDAGVLEAWMDVRQPIYQLEVEMDD
ncbi:MAG: hypothetical protein GX341_03600 [Firmicutes bacterium]|jgi:hypothetical protein|nr:hypothetical protein [Bacillota bacterium]